jgi:hypothetical protein
MPRRSARTRSKTAKQLTESSEDEVPATPVIQRNESLTTTRRRRRRRGTTISASTTSVTDSEDDSRLSINSTESNSTEEDICRHTQRPHVDAERLQFIIQQFDDEIETRCLTIKSMGDQCAAKIRRELKLQLFKLPTKVRQMTVREFKQVYGYNIDNVCKMEKEVVEKQVTDRILQTLQTNVSSCKTPRKKIAVLNNDSTPSFHKKKRIMNSNSAVKTQPAKKKARVDDPVIDLHAALQTFGNPQDQLAQAMLLKQQLEAMMADLQRNCV